VFILPLDPVTKLKGVISFALPKLSAKLAEVTVVPITLLS